MEIGNPSSKYSSQPILWEERFIFAIDNLSLKLACSGGEICNTALHATISLGLEQMAKLLLSKGADRKVKNSSNFDEFLKEED